MAALIWQRAVESFEAAASTSTKPGTFTALQRQHKKPSPGQHLGQEVLQPRRQSQGDTKGFAALPCCRQPPADEPLERRQKLSRLSCHFIERRFPSVTTRQEYIQAHTGNPQVPSSNKS